MASRYVAIRRLQPAAQYKTSISGCRVPIALTPRSTRSRSSASTHPTLGPGYDLQVGGGLSTNPMFAQRLGVFVEPARVPDVWLA